ncbi:hypothetical protein D3C86_1747410 [compost metagenome]
MMRFKCGANVYFTKPIPICSMPLPQLLDFVISPIMCGGTPKARAMSITCHCRDSSNCWSTADIVSSLISNPSVRISGMRRLP